MRSGDFGSDRSGVALGAGCGASGSGEAAFPRPTRAVLLTPFSSEGNRQPRPAGWEKKPSNQIGGNKG